MTEQVVIKFAVGGCSCCDAPQGSGGSCIAGSVGRGGRNAAADVRTIQSALNDQDPAEGGPSPRLAVDGVVGPLTIAAIEKYQRRKLGWTDGKIDPDGPTIHALQQTSPALKGHKHHATAPPKATAAQNKAFVERVGALLPQARHWISVAQMKIDMAVDYMNKGPGGKDDAFHDIGRPEFDLMDKYFHLAKLSRPQQAHAIGEIRRVYNLMMQVITESLLSAPMFGWGVGYFQPDPADGTLAANDYVAYTFFGGWHRRKNGKPRLSGDDNYAGDKTLRQDGVYFPVGGVQSKSDRFLIETIIHELGHFVGPGGPHNGERIADYTYDVNQDFLTVNPWTARHTADIYGYFAAEAALRKITIPLV